MTMPGGTKIRALTRQLDRAGSVIWVIDAQGTLIYLSAGASAWLGIDGESLIDRRSIAGTAASDDALDRVAAALSPPPGLGERGWATLRVAPPPVDGPVKPLDVHFVQSGSRDARMTFAIAGNFRADPADASSLADAAEVRGQLDAWRKLQGGRAAIATAGSSAAARRTRARLQVAAKTRSHVGFFGPAGCGAEAMARRVHHLSAPDEPLVVIDGPLMDAELLDATIGPLIHRLADSRDQTATALVRGLDETPADAQQRLAELASTYGDRLRLLSVCQHRPAEWSEPFESQDDPLQESTETPGVFSSLADLLSSLTVTVTPLRDRVDDIPLIAAALVDSRHAAGEGSAERLNRAALDALVVYPWPGDFSELAEAVRHAVRTAAGRTIGPEDLPLAIRSYRPGDPASAPKLPRLPLDTALRRFEMRLIREAIDAAGGNRAEAARQLGVSRATLIRRLDDHTRDD